MIIFQVKLIYKRSTERIHGLPTFCTKYSHQQKGIRPHLYYILAFSLRQLNSTLSNNCLINSKRLLGQKSILAHILVKTVDEFKGMNPKEVVSYIEGHP